MAGKGGARPNSGPKPGPKKKLRAEYDDIVRVTGIPPAKFLANKMASSNDEAIQIECAKALMPYCYRKKPEAREITGKVEAADPRLAVVAMLNLMGLS